MSDFKFNISSSLEELREYIRTLISERVRHSNFDINEFRTLVAAEKSLSHKRRVAMAYCNKYLTVLGAGSSRAAFRFSSRFAIKVAMNGDGNEQNAQELKVYSNPKIRPLLTKIVEHDGNNVWLMAEIVREIGSQREFFEMIGMPKNINVSLFQFMFYIEDKTDGLAEINGRSVEMSEIENLFSPELNMFIEQLRDLVSEGNLYTIELAVPGHWGKTADGRLVLLDYGLGD